MNTYLLSFDSARFSGQQHLLEAYLSGHRVVEAWSSPFKGCYLIKSTEESADGVSVVMDPFFERKGFIVAKVGIYQGDITGRAVPEIWKFVNPNFNDGTGI